jgi:hypothetical protein
MDWLELVEGSLLNLSHTLFKLYDFDFKVWFFFQLGFLICEKNWIFCVIYIGKHSSTNQSWSEGQEESWNFPPNVSGLCFFSKDHVIVKQNNKWKLDIGFSIFWWKLGIYFFYFGYIGMSISCLVIVVMGMDCRLWNMRGGSDCMEAWRHHLSVQLHLRWAYSISLFWWYVGFE